MNAATILKFTDVTKRYSKTVAVNNLSLEIKQGEKVALLGSNGAGKTSFLSMAAGLRKPSSGSIQILGSSVYNPQTKPLVTYLPQVLDFPSNITVNEIIDLVSTHYQTDYNFLNDLLEQLELKKLLKRKTSALSGGEKRKLGLVCTLLGRPQFAMLDEPTANIDVEGCVKIEEILKNYFNQNKTSLLFSSHQMQEVENLADKIVILKAGEIITQGPTSQIKKEFGLKKVSCYSTQNIKTTFAVSQTNNDNQYEFLCHNSDSLLKDIINKYDDVSDIDIKEPSLDEILIKLWSDK